MPTSADDSKSPEKVRSSDNTNTHLVRGFRRIQIIVIIAILAIFGIVICLTSTLPT
jgi:hypothetical protein